MNKQRIQDLTDAEEILWNTLREGEYCVERKAWLVLYHAWSYIHSQREQERRHGG